MDLGRFFKKFLTRCRISTDKQKKGASPRCPPGALSSSIEVGLDSVHTAQGINHLDA
jgi:hypothetical protein